MKTGFLSSNSLVARLKKEYDVETKVALALEHVSPPSWIEEKWALLSASEKFALLSLKIIGQDERVIASPVEWDRLKQFLSQLIEIDQFYAPIGGMIGYHHKVLQLMKKREAARKKGLAFRAPPVIDISHSNEPFAAVWGLEHLSQMAEIYALGGAADRLGLKDEKNGDFLPAAMLQFCGKTLLEHLIDDLQAREYLHYKLFGKQLITPIAMMTSTEKENHARVLAICEQRGWFGRPKESFRLFMQPLAPTLNLQGQWGLQAPMQLLLKPGGHGVIWRLAEKEGIFEWLSSLGRSKALIRQINNIIAGVDEGLLAFAGIGCKQNMRMGFASCSRIVRTSEGINVLVEKKKGKQSSYCLTNIEYCDLDRYGLQDEPMSLWNPYSKYPANTNLLFVDLNAVRRAAKKDPFPGMLVNAKKMRFMGANGEVEEEMLRLESTMQNIADSFVENQFPRRSYLTYNVRHKTISPIKRALNNGTLFETPEGCLYDYLKNGREVLVQHCRFTVPELPGPSDFLKNGPSFLFLYHPSLGPLYSIIGQKLRKGSLSNGSELRLEIADLDVQNLHVDGSLLIRTQAIMGHYDENGRLRFGERTGKCRLKNVRVHNAGLKDISCCNVWKNELTRSETCEILLEEGAEFEAENVTFTGPYQIHVPQNTRMRAIQREERIEWIQESLSGPSWNIQLSAVEGKIVSQVR